jgi:hypothetical protein
MDIVEKALDFEKQSMGKMTTSDRIIASREAKSIVLSLNEIYKKTNDPAIMDVMKLVTIKKKRIDKRLKF